MRSFQQVVVFLFALLVAAFAQEDSYDSTVYITSTVYRVNTVTMSGTPSAPVVNMTSTISASHVPTYPAMSSIMPNGTSVIAPSGSGSGSGSGSISASGSSVKPSQPQFTGAASAMNIPAYLAVLAAGAGYLVL
jgi:hypothetical protein